MHASAFSSPQVVVVNETTIITPELITRAVTYINVTWTSEVEVPGFPLLPVTDDGLPSLDPTKVLAYLRRPPCPLPRFLYASLRGVQEAACIWGREGWATRKVTSPLGAAPRLQAHRPSCTHVYGSAARSL